MMGKETRKRIVKVAAFAAGLAIAALALSGWRVPSTNGGFGADFQVALVPTGELSSNQSGSFLDAKGLRAGGPAATASATLSNISPKPRAFRMKLDISSQGLDEVLQVDVAVGNQHPYRGPLAGMTQWTATPFVLVPSQESQLKVSVWIPQGVASERYDGQIVDGKLSFEAVEGGRQ